MWPVVATQFLKTRVSPDVKHRVQQAATQQLITESTWLKQLVIEALGNSAQSITDEVESARSVELSSARDSRLYVRLRHDDRLLLRERVGDLRFGSCPIASKELGAASERRIVGTEALSGGARCHWSEHESDREGCQPRRQAGWTQSGGPVGRAQGR